MSVQSTITRVTGRARRLFYFLKKNFKTTTYHGADPNDFKLTGMVHAILEYSTHETATRASGLRLALRLFGKLNNDGVLLHWRSDMSPTYL